MCAQRLSQLFPFTAPWGATPRLNLRECSSLSASSQVRQMTKAKPTLVREAAG